jgi:hypothetical protein
LPAGRYVFKLLDLASDRNIVQIFNEDQTHLYANIVAIPNYRLQPTDKAVMTFRARAPGSAEAIRAWFYPGANWGEEFVYPKTRAVELAKLTDKPVPSMPSELRSNITRPAKSVNESPIMALKKTPLKAVKPTGQAIATTEITVWGPVQARPEASPVVDPRSSIKILTIRPQQIRLRQTRLRRVRIMVAIVLSLILAALVVFFARSFRSADWRTGTARVAPRGFANLRRSSQKGGPKKAA